MAERRTVNALVPGSSPGGGAVYILLKGEIMKKHLALLILPVAFLLSGCSIQEGEEISEHYPDSHYTFEQEMPDGTFVTCVWAKSGYGGGLSCDFEGAH